MDINIFRGVLTAVLLLAFLAMCYWVFSPEQKKRYERAANLPFDSDEGIRS